jgi:hypothetical protein
MSSKLKKQLLKSGKLESLFYGGVLYGFIIGATLIIFFLRVEMRLQTITDITLKLSLIGLLIYLGQLLWRSNQIRTFKIPDITDKLKNKFDDNKVVFNNLIEKS